MKRITICATAAVLLFLTTFVVVRAETRRGHGWCGRHWHHPGPMSYLAHELKLSDDQKTQIRTLWQAERPIVSADIHEFLAETKEMNAIAVQGNPDPSKVREIADREANTIATLLVEKVHLESKIYSTVLSPDQRAKADQLQKEWESRLDQLADRLGTHPAEK